jgi:prepilin-type N-terminal cleavage/methylation domain-containing protein
MFKMRGSAGFTLVEIMIVVAIIGLLAAIAIPSFMKARTTARLNACKAQRAAIMSAIERYAMDANQPESAVISAIQGNTTGGWQSELKDGKMPTCTAGPNGTYTYENGNRTTNDNDGTVATYTVTCRNYDATNHDPY